ncbi:MAG TPA: aminoacyl-tRNA hydrolase [Candidatus Babeliales bacterium]|jgi:PTH1 family peptidyl-tRNA hydrolase|nr:aminoacyl-tRNA hydrolase [Candidatus Babeliales bacterium]
MASIIKNIKAIIGLGNPGPTYYRTRHSIGYRIIDELAERFGGTWHNRDILQTATIAINDQPVLLIKSNTYMNDSGKAIPFILKKGIKPEEILVIHDELEKPFGTIGFKIDGSHRGHNGLRSIIQVCGNAFARLRIGIGRPEKKEDVPEYVLKPFTQSETDIQLIIDQAIAEIEKIFQ